MDQPMNARQDAPAYQVLLAWGVVWPQIDSLVTFLSLRAGWVREGNPLFALAFHAPLGMFGGLLAHVGLSLLVLAFAMTTRAAQEPAARRVGRWFLLAWAILGVVVVGHNGVTLLLAWLG